MTSKSVLFNDWKPNKLYRQGDCVLYSNHMYVCQYTYYMVLPPPSDNSMDWIRLNTDCNDLDVDVLKKGSRKRKYSDIEEQKIESYLGKKRNNNGLKERILSLDISLDIKSILFEKYKYMNNLSNTSEKQKMIQWLNIVCDLPFNKKKPMNVSKCSTLECKDFFFNNIKTKLDYHIYGLENAKRALIEHIGKMVTCKTQGNIIALEGIPGTGKTCLLRHGLSEALNVPFFQINCGGMSDGSVLVGHSDTYVNSRPGKIVEILIKAQCNNPIIYLDEIDKISKTRWREIYGILTHILDPEQNTHFVDNYIPEINIDLSNVTFVLSFNNASDVDPVVLDRLKVIKIPNPTKQTKLEITKRVLLPRLCKELNFVYNGSELSLKRNKRHSVSISEELLEYIISKKSPDGTGIRGIFRVLDDVMRKINLDVLLERNTKKTTIVTKEDVISILDTETLESLENINMMYI